MNRERLKILSQIFFTFFKLGCFSFGGGYAMVPLIEREFVIKKKWISNKEMVDIFAVSQSIPGAIAMNSAGFIGYYVTGIPGAITALLGSITSPLFIVLILSILFNKFSNNEWVQSAFMGIRPVIVSLIALAAYKVANTSVKDFYGVLIMAVAFITAFWVHPIFIIIGALIAGVTIASIKTYRYSKYKTKSVPKDSEVI
jgi:chromate transporter